MNIIILQNSITSVRKVVRCALINWHVTFHELALRRILNNKSSVLFCLQLKRDLQSVPSPVRCRNETNVILITNIFSHLNSECEQFNRHIKNPVVKTSDRTTPCRSQKHVWIFFATRVFVNNPVLRVCMRK